MAKIVIRNWSGKVIEPIDPTKPLLKIFQDHYLDWMHACGGKGRCTTCKVIVESGAENFVPLTPAETRYRMQGALKENERLSCQTRVTGTGEIVLNVPEEYKMPHIRYNASEDRTLNS